MRKHRRRYYEAHKALYSAPWRRLSWYSCPGYKLVPMISMEIGTIDRFTIITSPLKEKK